MATKKNSTTSTLSWIDSIAQKAKCNQEDVVSFMDKYKISQTPKLGIPRRIMIKKVFFSGTKDGVHSNDFEFKFDNLSSGLWGVFSEGNQQGKSSIVGVIKWLFRGTIPSELQDGVRSWINKLEVQFSIAETIYDIIVEQIHGNISGAIRLHKSDASTIILSKFSSEEEMSTVIGEFMLSELGLSQISTNRKGNTELDVSTEVIHGWPALSSVMFIGTNYEAIFGENILSGLSSRILGLYLGLPWIPTYSALKALEGKIKSIEKVDEIHKDRAKSAQNVRLNTIKRQLQEAKNRRSEIPSPRFSTEILNTLIAAHTNLYISLQTEIKDLSLLEKQLNELEAEAKSDKITLTKLLEEKAANKIFKRLNPVRCPHCEAKITDDRILKEEQEHLCSICDTKMITTDGDDELLKERDTAAAASQEALEQFKIQVVRQRNLVNTLSIQSDDKKDEYIEYKKNLHLEKDAIISSQEIDKEIFRLEILEAEYSQEAGLEDAQNSDSTQQSSIDDNAILNAAIKVTESMYSNLQETLLEAVSKKILEYCQKVGLKQYQNVKLNGGPQLRINKDGKETSFSKVSPGEKLRLKVISTIALISVAEEKGYGRHPGFLVIDSPGAQEVADETLQALITGLKDLCNSVKSLQVIIASRANPILLKEISEERRKYAKKDEFLW